MVLCSREVHRNVWLERLDSLFNSWDCLGELELLDSLDGLDIAVVRADDGGKGLMLRASVITCSSMRTPPACQSHSKGHSQSCWTHIKISSFQEDEYCQVFLQGCDDIRCLLDLSTMNIAAPAALQVMAPIMQAQAEPVSFQNAFQSN